MAQRIDRAETNLKRRLDWALHASAGFAVGFWSGMAALAAWLAWMAYKEELQDEQQERAIRDHVGQGWP